MPCPVYVKFQQNFLLRFPALDLLFLSLQERTDEYAVTTPEHFCLWWTKHRHLNTITVSSVSLMKRCSQRPPVQCAERRKAGVMVLTIFWTCFITLQWFLFLTTLSHQMILSFNAIFYLVLLWHFLCWKIERNSFTFFCSENFAFESSLPFWSRKKNFADTQFRDLCPLYWENIKQVQNHKKTFQILPERSNVRVDVVKNVSPARSRFESSRPDSFIFKVKSEHVNILWLF